MAHVNNEKAGRMTLADDKPSPTQLQLPKVTQSTFVHNNLSLARQVSNRKSSNSQMSNHQL